MFVGHPAYNGSGVPGGPPIPNAGGQPDPVGESSLSSERLDSWKEIASHLKRSVRTVTRWEREQGLPVHRHKTGTVYAYKSELDVWWSSRGQQMELEPPDDASPPAPKSKPIRKWTLAAAVGLLVAVTVGWVTLRPNPEPQPKLVPLTTYPGIEGAPALSPDGNQVVFARNGDLFIKQVDDETSRQLTNTPEAEGAPVWSPDGRRVAFRRGPALILTISPLGGPETRVAEARVPDSLRRIAWTADSQSLIFSELTSAVGSSLFMISIASGEKRQLTWPSGPGIGEGSPSVSPDGQTLAFAHYPQDSWPTIDVLPMSGGVPRVLTTAGNFLAGLTWSPDGKEIVFSSDRTGVPRLWRIPANLLSPSSPLPVEAAGENARFPSFSQAGNQRPRLAYQKFEQDFDLRRAELERSGAGRQSLKPSSRFLVSTKLESHPRFSPDGKRIAFMSQRSGTHEVWLADSDGSNPVRLTSMRGPVLNGPRWSSDGRQIGFHATTGRGGNYQIYVVNVAGGRPVLLSRDEYQPDFLPTWTRDGRWIYFGSGRSGTVQLWKMPAGGGDAVQITKSGGADVRESADGSIYYTKVGEAGAGLWRMATKGGDETKILDTPWSGFWDLAPKGIYFIDFGVQDDAPRPVKFFNFETHETTQIGAVENSVKLGNPFGFTVSPDERWLVYTSLEGAEADLMLVDNYR
ncbi:MAG TPA: DPP IV N-terminal domain-containing protein [Bryobacteraceae bacterium]|jgi:Tol biopolymer transport system component